MKHNIKSVNNCIVCGDEFSNDWKDLLDKSEFTQSWCKVCILKNGHSHPTTREKIESIQELNRLERLKN